MSGLLVVGSMEEGIVLPPSECLQIVYIVGTWLTFCPDGYTFLKVHYCDCIKSLKGLSNKTKNISKL